MGLGRQPLKRGGIGDVGLDCERGAAPGLDRGRHPVDAADIDIGQHDLHARSGRLQRQSFANAAPGAGDDRDAVPQGFHAQRSFGTPKYS